MEEWRDIEGFPFYQVSDLGRVRSFRPKTSSSSPRTVPIILKQQGKGKYRHVSLGRCTARVHRLVLAAFVGPCPEGEEACHRNGDSSDNRSDNLRWDTRRSNHRDQYKHGTRIMGEKHPMSKLTEAEVMAIYTAPTGTSSSELGAIYDVSRQAIDAIRKGKTWSRVTKRINDEK